MEQEAYLVEGEFAFRSYTPTDGLKVGMHFLSAITVGVLEPQHHFFTLGEVPEDEDMFMSLHGAPIKMFIISSDGDEEILANSKEVGYFTSGKEDDLHPITDEEINTILNDYDSCMDIECDEEGSILLIDGKVIISYLSESEEEEEDE